MDVSIHYHGSVVMVEPVTSAAKEWVDENVQLEGWQWMGNTFAVDPHMLENLVCGMRDDGLEVA